jgi:hypothetical protein
MKIALGLVAPLFVLACGTVLAAEAPSADVGADAREAGAESGKQPQEAAAGGFLRIERNGFSRPVALQTAIVRYVPASGEGDLVVDLVACVHMAEASYYEELNRRLEQYDVVLYELVAPRGARVPKGGARDGCNPLVMLQQMTESMLELEPQVEHLDYTKANFVHADMSPADIAEKMRERGDDGLSLVLSVSADLIRQHNLREREREKNPHRLPPDPFDPLLLLFDPDPAATMKQKLAAQFTEPGAIDLGGTLNTMLIKDRNEVAMRVFQTELAKGKKRIAILYGAGHMADFEKRLTGDFGLRRDRVEWLTAWNLLSAKRGAR